jgi:hypothetical protein
LRENDPVFNGYVVKITGDSVVFQETVQDKLGKTFTREVVKKNLHAGGLDIQVSGIKQGGDRKRIAEIKFQKDTRARPAGGERRNAKATTDTCSYRCWSSRLMGVTAAAAQTPSQLDRVNVVRGTDDIRVEMSSSGTVTPKLSTLDSPARVVVDLPETVMATGQTHIAVGAAGVKGVRIGSGWPGASDHPHRRRSRQACAYDLTPGAGGQAGFDPARPTRGKAERAALRHKTVPRARRFRPRRPRRLP